MLPLATPEKIKGNKSLLVTKYDIMATPEKIKGNKSLLVTKYDIMATPENIKGKGNVEYLIIKI